MASSSPPVAAGVRVRVPAKINLALKVGAPRADGYHPLATVYQAVSVYDEVHAAWADPDEFEVVVSGEGADFVPLDDSNLAVRAAKLLARRHGPHDALGASLSIKKSIPVAGGLAGGSANGAAALLACAVLWDLDVTPDELSVLAAELGSDVPFALLGGTAVGSGRGEDVAPALARGTYHWVLAFGFHGLSTAAVYRRFDELSPRAAPPTVPADLMNALRSGDPRLLARPSAMIWSLLRWTCSRDCAPCWRPASSTALWAPWCLDRVLPVPSWRTVSPLRSTSPYRSVQRGCAAQSGARQARSREPGSSTEGGRCGCHRSTPYWASSSRRLRVS